MAHSSYKIFFLGGRELILDLFGFAHKQRPVFFFLLLVHLFKAIPYKTPLLIVNGPGDVSQVDEEFLGNGIPDSVPGNVDYSGLGAMKGLGGSQQDLFSGFTYDSHPPHLVSAKNLSGSQTMLSNPTSGSRQDSPLSCSPDLLAQS